MPGSDPAALVVAPPIIATRSACHAVKRKGIGVFDSASRNAKADR